ncbi:hypothetical protein ACFL6Y_10715 [Elusimicrobiota bacterium]
MTGFVQSLESAKTLVTSEGMWQHFLGEYLPKARIIGLGEALLSVDDFRKKFDPDTIYILDSRGYHARFEDLVFFYEKFNRETGCHLNLDLQHMGIVIGSSSLQAQSPQGHDRCLAQARWALRGRKVKRVIVENMCDVRIFQKVTGVLVMHISQYLTEKVQTPL